MSYSLSAKYLSDQLFSRGIKDIVVSPGSRNAPLVHGFAANKNYKLHAQLDERNAAYYALGLSLLGKKVALICTSGSAVYNYASGLSESWYQDQGILVITADRPTELIEQKDSQTINQLGALQEVVCFQAKLQNDNQESQLWYNLREIDRALNAFITGGKNVHINVPLSDPLYQPTELNENLLQEHIPTLEESPSVRFDFTSISEKLKNKKVAVIVGQCSPAKGNLLSKAFERNKHKLAVFAESTSNICTSGVREIDKWIASLNDHSELPDCIIYCGGHIVSKKLKHLFRDNRDIEVWRVEQEDYYPDTFQRLHFRINISSEVFFENVESEDWQNYSIDYRNAAKLELLNNQELCDLEVYSLLYQELHEIDHWHFANSSSIRYAQLFNYPKKAFHFANRGVSGIEGCTSTAIGVSAADGDKQNLLVSGDLAMMYNINALQHVPKNLKIILINNQGGNIFTLIDGPKEVKGFNDYIKMSDEYNLQHICKQFNLPYYHCDNRGALLEELKRFANHKGSALLEIRTNGELNQKQLKHYFKSIAKGEELKIKDN